MKSDYPRVYSVRADQKIGRNKTILDETGQEVYHKRSTGALGAYKQLYRADTGVLLWELTALGFLGSHRHYVRAAAARSPRGNQDDQVSLDLDEDATIYGDEKAELPTSDTQSAAESDQSVQVVNQCGFHLGRYTFGYGGVRYQWRNVRYPAVHLKCYQLPETDEEKQVADPAVADHDAPGVLVADYETCAFTGGPQPLKVYLPTKGPSDDLVALLVLTAVDLGELTVTKRLNTAHGHIGF
ncbi:hypothetical protein IWQ60_002915 [Tieghemiomyces parasiticus]|uniref:Uncharacterized protein n=1 Tax=Tieghemiomyces parasiticus TaxID=78921 RepID=A0A9W8AGK0_9FUNG|nr:hypothetical protein IWQ60_002915 [Tieghemiomyces parasiticus]